MKIGVFNIQSRLMFLITFLGLFGFYVVLLLFSNFYSLELSRTITAPMRFLEVFLIILLLFIGKKRSFSLENKLFSLFAAFYLARIFFDQLVNTKYIVPSGQLYILFISMAVIPFLVINSIKFNEHNIRTIKNTIAYTALIFGALSNFFYLRFVGSVGRLSTSTVGEEVLSPLTLSYCASLAIGFGIILLLTEANSRKDKLLYLIIVTISIVPFLLGSSRGAVFALFVPFILFFMFGSRIGRKMSKFQILMAGIAVLALLVFAANKYGSNVFNRFTNISSDIDRESASAIRTQIWKQALSQFADRPIFGDSFAIKGFSGYSHNLFVEVLLTTGVVGFFPFLWLIIRAFKAAFRLFKRFPEYSWASIFFLQCFIRMFFSGALYSGSWFWFSLGILFAVDYYLKQTRVREIEYLAA